MRDIQEILFDEFSQEEIHDDLEYNDLICDLDEIEKSFRSSLNKEQDKAFQQLQQTQDNLAAYNEVRLINFVLSFIQSFFTNKK